MDIFKQMCVGQGYVPLTCTMDGKLCWLLVNKQGNPCIGCNEDKAKCKTRNKTTK